MEIKVNKTQTEIPVDNTKVTTQQVSDKNTELFTDEVNDTQNEDVEVKVDVSNLDEIAKAEAKIAEAPVAKPETKPETKSETKPEEEKKEEPEKKKNIFVWIYDWVQKDIVPAANKFMKDVEVIKDVLDLDNVTTETLSNGAMVSTEISFSKEIDSVKVKTSSNKKYNPQKDESKISSQIEMKSSNDVGYNLKLDSSSTIKTEVIEKGKVLSTLDPDFAKPQQMNDDAKVDLKYNGKEALTYTPNRDVKIYTALEANEEVKNDSVSNDVKATLGTTVYYEPTDNTKGSTTVQTSEQYVDTALKNDTSVTSEFSYKDTLYRLSDREVILSASTKEKAYYNNELVFNTGVLNQNVGLDSNLSATLNYNDLLYTNGKTLITMQNSLGETFNYKNNYDVLNDNFTWSTDLKTSVSTSLTFKFNQYFTMNANVNGSYTLSSGDDSYSFGGGFSGLVTPVPSNKDFKINFGAGYKQSDVVNPSVDKLTQQVSLNAGVAFNKNFGLTTSYDINIDGKKPNDLNFGVKVNF